MSNSAGDRTPVWLTELSRPSVIITLVAVVGSGGAWVGTQIVSFEKMSDRQDRTEQRIDKLENGFVALQRDMIERVTGIERQGTATSVSLAQISPELRAIREILGNIDERAREADTRTTEYVRRIDERESRHNEQVMQLIKQPGAK